MLRTGGRLCDTASSATWPRGKKEEINRGKPFIGLYRSELNEKDSICKTSKKKSL